MQAMQRLWFVPSDSLAVINCYVRDELIESCFATTIIGAFLNKTNVLMQNESYLCGLVDFWYCYFDAKRKKKID